MKPALVDDQHLRDILRAVPAPSLRGRSIYTTGYWYVRLCQAVLGRHGGAGVLSAPFASLPESLRARAVAAVMQLPDSIGLISLRELAPRIGELRQHHSLNILGMEALAAAKQLDAEVFLSAASPQLQAALSQEGVAVRIDG